MCEAAERNAGKLVVIATGPLTNLAVALQHDPKLATHGQPQ